MRVLVVDLNFMGDVLMTSPAIKALHDYGNEVAVLCHPFAEDVVKANPYVRGVWTVGQTRTQKIAMAKALKLLEYDMTIHFNTSLENNVIIRLMCAKRRLGYAYKWNGFGLTDSVVIPHRTLTKGSRVDEVCSLLERGLGYEIGDRRTIFKVEKKIQLPDKDFIVIHCNTRNTQTLRRWDKFRLLASELSKRYGWRLYYTGVLADRQYVRENIQDYTSLNLCGGITVQELASVLQQARLCVTVNTFTMHLAIALGTPTVALIGGTDASVICPKNNPNFKYVQDDKLNMSNITVEQVMDKINELLTSA